MVTVATERPTLPVLVLEQPHWRVNFRPDEYDPELIPSPPKCFRLVEQTRVFLQSWSWSYPYLSNRPEERRVRTNGVEAWTASEYMTEYWRFYQSGQFLHLFTFEEASKVHSAGQQDGRRLSDSSEVRGFVHFPDFLCTVTQIFEFATRLCLKELYRGSLEVTIELKDIERFRLWSPYLAPFKRYEWVCHEPELRWTRPFPVVELIANNADYALDAAIWFFERFGWEDRSKDALRRDQRALLSWYRGG